MEHDLSPEANDLRDLVRAFLERRSPESAVRQVVETGMGRDPEVWTQMAQQLGLQGLLVPEALGGQGTTFVETSVVLEEMGRALLPGPFLSTAVLAVTAVRAAGDDPWGTQLLAGIAAGETVAAVAFSEGLLCDPGESTVAATRSGDGWVLDGGVDVVLDGQSADTLLVVAPAGDELGLFLVAGGADGVGRTPLAVLDLTREAAQIELSGVGARRLGGDFRAAQRAVLAVGASAMAAEMAGAVQRLLEMAVEYAKVREQFGRPIGSFQAVKHLCADIFAIAESATAVARHAARAVVDGSGAAEAASLAKAYTSDGCMQVAEMNIQVHGGIGFTWEHPAHLYLRRITSAAQYFGSAGHHRERLAELLGLAAAASLDAREVSPAIGEPAGDLLGRGAIGVM
ncbi:acyl-CoA dehydrogenase family protein [Pseudonocardia kunmingensis]|uniref:Alkylation response protein AidB-like acyl-CoA dehydrogenase n=1 Tax=Pseudonocardia kunmingensis TaxID=630975 RepID=A0A543DPG0_9PSEU|nr:acyl-CoA dehydrogenase family protein [Pseudonocardia kunmingensis]TQM11221.1 alkylation response protein AidB-like acyl-CoA dehydrogenase [Pseudonocardia kunmingensis]